MSLDILEAAKRLLPDSLVTKAALSLGESEINIRKALKGALPAILAGLLHQSSRREGLGIMDLLKDVGGSEAMSNLSGILDSNKNPSAASTNQGSDFGPTIAGWLKSVFDGKLINIVNAISVYADIKSSSANAILKLSTPVALTPVAQYAEENNMSAADIDSFLQSQKSSVITAVPSGFNLTGSLGINTLNDVGVKIITTPPKPSEYQRRVAAKNAAGKWVWPLLLLLTFGGLVWFFSNRARTSKDTATNPVDTVTVPVKIIPVNIPTLVQIPGKLDSVTGNYIYDQGTETELKFPDSTVLKVGANSTEARLFKMLTDTAWSIDTMDKTKNWISFDRAYFEKGKAILTLESQAQVKNIATILKKFPASSIKIGGYTDNTGDSVINKKISGERAKKVMSELIKLGAAPTQINEAAGYGSEHPVCPANDTPDCKARNRRVDLKVASK
ncbi:MAG: OmpA family protein [Chitinophagaceae bacterium]